MRTISHRSRRQYGGLRLLGAVLALVATEATATRINSDLCVNAPEPDERRQHHSTVYDAFGARVAHDYEYARQLRGGPAAPRRPGARGLAVDVVMQQCFGGGLLNDVINSGIRRHTFASAASWREVAWFGYDRTPRGLQDLTRAWRRDADTAPFGGMLSHFSTALCGRPVPPAAPVIPRDVYAPGGPRAGRRPEHPQYASPDAARGGANDLRELGGALNENQSGHPANAADRQFAILVAWSQPEDADRLDIARVFNTLTQTHNVARSHIAVLYPRACTCAADADCTTRARTSGQCTNGTCTAGTSRRVACTANADCGGGQTCRLPALGPYDSATPDDAGPGAFAAIDVQGTNSEADWLRALDGDFFRPAAGALVEPQEGDQLLIYNTGHGSHLKRLPRKERHLPFTDGGGGAATNLRVEVDLTDGFDVSLDSDALPVVTDADQTDLIQLTLRRSADDAYLRVNGVLLPEPLGAFRTSPADAISVAPFVGGSTVRYQVRVDHALLAQYPAAASLEILGLGGTVDGNVVAAVVFQGGRQQYAAVLSACTFDTNGDGVADLTLDDADDDGLCE
jgi:hypothetical protein